MRTFRILYQTDWMGWADEIELPANVTEDEVLAAAKAKDLDNYKNIVEIFEV